MVNIFRDMIAYSDGPLPGDGLWGVGFTTSTPAQVKSNAIVTSSSTQAASFPVLGWKFSRPWSMTVKIFPAVARTGPNYFEFKAIYQGNGLSLGRIHFEDDANTVYFYSADAFANTDCADGTDHVFIIACDGAQLTISLDGVVALTDTSYAGQEDPGFSSIELVALGSETFNALLLTSIELDGTADATPNGPLSVAVDGLRTLLANVPEFRNWTGTADANDALARVFVGEVGYPVASVTIAGGVLTVATRDRHKIQAGDLVTLEGASLGSESSESIDGPQTVASVTANTVTIATGLPDAAPVFPDGAMILPSIRPFAVICEDSDPVRATSVGTGGASVFSGSLDILFEADVSTDYQNDQNNALYEARNAFGLLVQGISRTQETGDFIFLSKVEPVSSPQFIAREKQDNNAVRFERWQGLVRVAWGMDG